MSEIATNGRILVVDDNEINVDVLVETLSPEYEVSVALDGQTALDIVGEVDPDIILLDIMMPEIDGYEVCQRLKENENTRDIAVIFLTAMSDVANETKGLGLGAIDYLTKPFNGELIRMRIRNHMALRRARRLLQQQNQHLEEAVAERTRELAEAHEQLKILDAARRDYLNVVAHDLRTPINGLLGITQIALDEVSDEAERQELTNLLQKSRWRLEETIENAFHLARLQLIGHAASSEPIELQPILTTALEQVRHDMEDSMVQITLPAHPNRYSVRGDAKLLLLALRTLMRLAVRLAHPTSCVTLETADQENNLLVKFTLRGNELSADEMAHLFDECHENRMYSKLQDLGFAVPLAEKIIRSFGGQVYIVNIEDGLLVCCMLRCC